MVRKNLGRDRSIWSRLRAGGNDGWQVEVDTELAESEDVVAECARLYVVNNLEKTLLDIDDEQGGLSAIDPSVGEIGRGGWRERVEANDVRTVPNAAFDDEIWSYRKQHRRPQRRRRQVWH